MLAAQRGGHPIMLQFLLQLLAPGSILRVIADESKIFELLFHVIALSFLFDGLKGVFVFYSFNLACVSAILFLISMVLLSSAP